MSFFAVLDALNDFYPVKSNFDLYVNKFSEVVELAIATVGVLYVRLNAEVYLDGKQARVG